MLWHLICTLGQVVDRTTMQMNKRCHYLSAFLFMSVFTVVLSCELSEFECSHPADGCIPWQDVNNGEIDCLRDGSDETREARTLAAQQLFPQGLYPERTVFPLQSGFSVVETDKHKNMLFLGVFFCTTQVVLQNIQHYIHLPHAFVYEPR